MGDAWGSKSWPKECSIVIEAGFNGGGLRSHSWLGKYLEYIKSFYRKASVVKNERKSLRFAFWGHEWRDSEMGALIPIWANGKFKPARVGLIRGKTELLTGLDITQKMDSAVNLGRNQFKVGQSEWEMVAFNGKNRWVIPLVQTACTYTKLDERFWEITMFGN